MLMIHRFRFKIFSLLCVISLGSNILSGSAFSSVDKVYHPYVEINTWEFETRAIGPLTSELSTDFSIYRFGLGKDLLDNLFVEFYAIGNRNNSDTIDIQAYEIEALYQWTEQGEYWLDVGLLFELEKNIEKNEWEGNIALLLEKEIGRWSASLNLHQQYVFVDDRKHEWEVKQAFQTRYRYSSIFEPGIEIYTDQQDTYLGFVALGSFRQGLTKIGWEIGFLSAISHSEEDSLLRLLLEVEF